MWMKLLKAPWIDFFFVCFFTTRGQIFCFCLASAEFRQAVALFSPPAECNNVRVFTGTLVVVWLSLLNVLFFSQHKRLWGEKIGCWNDLVFVLAHQCLGSDFHNVILAHPHCWKCSTQLAFLCVRSTRTQRYRTIMNQIEILRKKNYLQSHCSSNDGEKADCAQIYRHILMDFTAHYW